MEVNKIYCWDCVEIMKEIEDWTIDMTITSPPYDNLRSYEWYSFDFEWTAKELYRITKECWVVVWIVNDATVNWSETWTSFRQALYFKEIWFNLHDTMIWQKNNFSNPSFNRYHQIFEYMFVLSKWKPKTFNPLIDRKNVCVWWRPLWKTTRRQRDWWFTLRWNDRIVKEYWMRYNIWKWNTTWQENMCKHIEHPATFPLWLVKDHIRSWSNEWDTVLDPFIWSWTTAVACEELNRNFIWIEISPKYCEIANKRISDLFT